ncbi:MAG: hypothetical protein K2G89_00225 [Lachnospiraceae bacterium]|nr:hypothetical protein [Lachnospiraceae bacterium]
MEVGLGSLLVSLFFTVAGCTGLMRIIKDIKRIKPDSGDGNVKAVVVNIDPFLTGDVAPIVTYTSGSGEEKKYKYYYWYNRKNIQSVRIYMTVLTKEFLLHV